MGWTVLCDRYVPTSLVLQRIDGVEQAFLWQLNQYADQPDLTIILTGDPPQLRARAHQRGTYSRFHRGDRESAEVVAAVLLDAILERLAMRSG